MRASGFLAALVALSAGGCALTPSPHHANLTPPVTGSLTARGAPAARVPVAVCEASRESCCVGRKSESVTSPQGLFAVEPVTRFDLFLRLMAHRRFHWCVSVHVAGRWQSAGPFSVYTLVDSGPTREVSVTCSIEGEALSCQEPVTAGRSGT